MHRLIVANWKMNPASRRAADGLLKAYQKYPIPKHATLVVCPPFPYLGAFAGFKKKNIRLGSQNAAVSTEGPYTGEVSAVMLAGMGAEYVILGHSERRALGERDEEVAKKTATALTARLRVILCIGEPLPVRRKGSGASRSFIAGQLKRSLKGVPKELLSNVIVAYEPVWAISTSKSGKAESPADAAAMIRSIKTFHHGKALYGGSVNAGNAAGFLAHREIDGLLVGHASLNPKEFMTIIRHA